MRNNRKILLGSIFSSYSGWLDIITILIVATYIYSGSLLVIGVVSSSNLLPMIFVSPLLSKLLVNYDQKSILQFSLLIRTIIGFLLFLPLSLEMFVFLLVIRSLSVGLFLPIIGSQTPSKNNIEKKSFLFKLELIKNSSKILCPMIGAFIGLYIGYKEVFLISAILSLFSFLVFNFSFLKKPFNEKKIEYSYKESTVESSKSFYFIIFFFTFSLFVLNNFLPAVLKNYGYDSKDLGLLVSFAGAGNVIGSFIVRYLYKDKVIHETSLYLLSSVVFLLIMVFGILLENDSFSVIYIYLSFLLIGLFSSQIPFIIQINITIMTDDILQQMKEFSRVQSYEKTAMVLGPLVGGYLLNFIDGGELFTLIGFLMFLINIILFLYYFMKIRTNGFKSS